MGDIIEHKRKKEGNGKCRWRERKGKKKKE